MKEKSTLRQKAVASDYCNLIDSNLRPKFCNSTHLP